MIRKSGLFLSAIVVLLAFVFGCKPGVDSDGNSADPIVRTPDEPAQNGFAASAERYEAPDRVIWQKPDLVINQLGDVKGKVIADLGAGTGYFSRRLAYIGATVIAIDIDPSAIQWMEAQKSRFPPELRERLIIRQATPDDPRLQEAEVDKVLLVNTYTYIRNRVDYFRKLRTAIRPGGTILIIDFKKKDTPFGPELATRLDEGEVIQELEDAGYSLHQVDNTSLDYQYIITVGLE